MSDNPTGPELLAQSIATLRDVIDPVAVDQNNSELLKIAQVQGLHALAAVALMAVENMHEYPPYEVEAWRDVIPLPPLRECKGKEIRRPECEERHTEDCAYVDPKPEPKHVLLAVGTRVLVSDVEWDEDRRKMVLQNPQAGRISGYDMHKSKYRWQREWSTGEYYSHESWAFADNRVIVHPDGPECPSAPKPVKREPTGPRLYFERRDGRQGHVIEVFEADGIALARVQFYTPGAGPVVRQLDLLTFIPESRVQRCPNGQTGDVCGSGENQCEPCIQAEDEEGDEIERSMGLR